MELVCVFLLLVCGTIHVIDQHELQVRSLLLERCTTELLTLLFFGNRFFFEFLAPQRMYCILYCASSAYARTHAVQSSSWQLNVGSPSDALTTPYNRVRITNPTLATVSPWDFDCACHRIVLFGELLLVHPYCVGESSPARTYTQQPQKRRSHVLFL